MAGLRALAMNCSLKRSKGSESSSTDRLLREFLDALGSHDVTGEIVRIADLNILPGVTADEGEGDDWPALRTKLLAADILLIGSPVWLGQQSSVAKRVLERMDAFLDEKDDRGRMPTYGKVGAVAVVGNEDGAHRIIADICQAMSEVGFTIPAGGGTYWVGEALGSTDYKDLPESPKAVAEWTKMLAGNVAHLASVLKQAPYPGQA